MYTFPLPFYNIAGCATEQKEERLIDWLVEQTGERKRTSRAVNVIHDDGTTTIYPGDRQFDDHWYFKVPGIMDLVFVTGGDAWYHKRIARFEVGKFGQFEELLDDSEIHFAIEDEFLALQFKLIM